MPAFNSVTGAEAGRKGRGACGKGKRQSPRSQVIELQTLAMQSAADPETSVAVQAALMRAYVDLQELRLTLEGIGRPKPVEARNATPRKKTRSAGPLGPARKPEPITGQATPGQVAGEQTNPATQQASNPRSSSAQGIS
jgi:hypothetical protein